MVASFSTIFLQVLHQKYRTSITISLHLSWELLLLPLRRLWLIPNRLVFLNLLLSITICFLYLSLCFSDKASKKILACLLVSAISVASEFLSLSLALMGNHKAVEMLNLQNSNTPIFTIVTLISTILILVFSQLTVKIWNFFLGHQKELDQKDLILFLIPISQVFMLTGYLEALFEDFTITTTKIIFAMLLSVLANTVMFYVSHKHKQKHKLDLQLQELAVLRQMEEARYNEMQRSQEEFAKLEHDFNNQLSTVLHLIRQGDCTNAEELIKQLHCALQDDF